MIGRMKIATWNVNSIRQREGHVKRWLERVRPDLLFLQEIKCETAAFPASTYQSIGYQCDAVGQKAYNGVAVLSLVPFQVVYRTLPGLPEDYGGTIAADTDKWAKVVQFSGAHVN